MQCEFLTSMPDGELLKRYTEGQQDAFAELVERYQPMVMRVCRQVLGTSTAATTDADDAFQQTFIALSIKASTLFDRDSVASWLYRVAWNISSKTRRALKTRMSHESAASNKSPWHNPDRETEPDTLMVLHEALAEIPDIYRQAIVLHYFCGYTTAEAAARLRCPAGTVAARVSRGLQQLRTQLSNRDLILTIVAIKLVLLGIMNGSKAAAAATTTTAAARLKGGLPRYRPPYRPSLRRLLPRAMRALALLPTGFAYSVLGSRFASTGRTSTYGWHLPWWKLPCNLNLGPWGKFFAAMQKKPALACAMTAMICAGAGTAARVAIESLTPVEQQTAVAPLKPSNPTTPSNTDDDPKSDDQQKNASHNTGSAFAVTPVPEPASLSFLGCAGLMLSGRRNRRR